jgi:phospholipid-binding lipoprotein MlaA
MKTFRTLLLAAIVLSTTACASNIFKNQGTLTTAEVQPAPTTVAGGQLDGTRTSALAMPTSQDAAATFGAAADAGGATANGAPGQTEEELESADAEVVVRDPWQGFNRRMHGFNNAADKFVLRPLAVGYKKITPEPVQAGVSRFFGNLSMPVTAVNQALQGRPGDAGRSLGRFAVNTTVGIVGVFDPASHMGLPKGGDEDFGQTLATWGWRDSRYLVLPLLGPRTVRDALGIVGDTPLSPIGQVHDSGVASGLQLMEIVDVRTQMLPIDKFRRDAFDDYSFVRDAWAQRRNQQIQPELRSNRD